MDSGVAAARIPEFKRHLRAEVNEGEGAYLFSEHGVTALRGAAIASLAALLDGKHDLADLLEARPGGMSSTQVASVIEQLVDVGLVSLRGTEASPVDESEVAYWDACGVDLADAARAAVATVALVATKSTVDLGPARRALAGDRSGRPHRTQPLGRADRGGLRRLPRPGAGRHRRRAPRRRAGRGCWPSRSALKSGSGRCSAGRPGLLALPFPPALGAPSRGGAARRRRSADGACPSRPAASVPALAAAAAHLMALEATKWLAGHRYPGQSAVWTFDSLDLPRHAARTARPARSARTAATPALVAAQACTAGRAGPARKAVAAGGGHRTLPPAAGAGPLPAPDQPGHRDHQGDQAGPGRAGRSSTPSAPGSTSARGTTGLGTLRASLRVGERRQGAHPAGRRGGGAVRGRRTVLRHLPGRRGPSAGEPARARRSGRAPQRLHSCSTSGSTPPARVEPGSTPRSSYVSEPFDEDAVIDWTPVWSLTERRHRLLPTGDAVLRRPGQPVGSRADSNGNAAGSSLEDAMLQGTLELVERDAVAMWWYNRLRLPGGRPRRVRRIRGSTSCARTTPGSAARSGCLT